MVNEPSVYAWLVVSVRTLWQLPGCLSGNNILGEEQSLEQKMKCLLHHPV
jgi:hypothetical protein